VAPIRNEHAAWPEPSRKSFDLVPLFEEVKLELRELELVQKLRLVELQPRIPRAHLKFKECRFGNQHTAPPINVAHPITHAFFRQRPSHTHIHEPLQFMRESAAHGMLQESS
jgi:hypothetical protein